MLVFPVGLVCFGFGVSFCWLVWFGLILLVWFLPGLAEGSAGFAAGASGFALDESVGHCRV